jgi:hypothetical protein
MPPDPPLATALSIVALAADPPVPSVPALPAEPLAPPVPIEPPAAVWLQGSLEHMDLPQQQ